MTTQSTFQLVDDCRPCVDQMYRLAETLHLDPNAISERGFLVTDSSRERYQDSVNRGFVTCAVAGWQLAGYGIAIPWNHADVDAHRKMIQAADPSVDLDALPNLMWFDQLAVSAAFHRQGVGIALFRRLLHKHAKSAFVSTVSEKPYANNASIRFHEKQGFIRIGTIKADVYLGIKDYQAAIFLKRRSV